MLSSHNGYPISRQPQRLKMTDAYKVCNIAADICVHMDNLDVDESIDWTHLLKYGQLSKGESYA